jgi:hypothetical protein
VSFHSVAVVLALIQTKQIRINIHKRNNTKTQYKQYKTQSVQVHITKTPTQLSKHPHITKPVHIHPHITKPTHTHNHTLQNKLKKHSTG